MSTTDGDAACLRLVLAHVSTPDLVAASQVSRVWRVASASPELWHTLDIRNSRNPAGWLAAFGSCSRAGGGSWTGVDGTFCQQLRGEDLSSLPRSLTSLNLNGCRGIDNAGIEMVARTCPNLTRLELYWNTHITSSALAAIGRGCPGLAYLNCSGCKGVTDDGVRSLAKALQPGALSFLDLTRCHSISDRAIEDICCAHKQLNTLILFAAASQLLTDRSCLAMGQLRSLRKLDMCGAQEITDVGVIALLRGSSATIRHLNLTWCKNLTDASMGAIAQAAHLEFLCVFGLVGISSVGLRHLAAGVGHSLHTLDVNGCCGVAEYRDRDSLRKLFPRVHRWVVHS